MGLMGAIRAALALAKERPRPCHTRRSQDEKRERKARRNAPKKEEKEEKEAMGRREKVKAYPKPNASEEVAGSLTAMQHYSTVV